MNLEPEKKLTPDEEIKTYKMEEGDYTIQVRIIEANDLMPTIQGYGFMKSKGSSCNAFVEVEISGKKKKTKIIKGSISPFFNQMFTFKLENLKKQQLRDLVIQFTAKDKSLLTSSIIGQYELDLQSVYFSLHHEMYRSYLTLSDPTDEREGIMGYLLVNISVLGSKDEPFIHNLQTENKSDSAQEKSLVPSKIKQTAHSVNVKLFRGEHMAPKDITTSKIDAYVIAKFAGFQQKSKTVTSRNPIWNQELNLGIMLPNQSKFVQFSCYDHDLLSDDDLVGVFKIIFKDFQNRIDIPPKWHNMYGAPLKGKGDHANLMNLYGDVMGSHYRGRVLMQLSSQDERDSKTSCKDLEFSFPDNPEPICEQKSYILRVDIIEAHQLPQRKQAIIQVLIGPYLLSSKPVVSQDGAASFYEQLPDKKVLFPKDIEQVPDIIFYFTDENIEDRRHSFFRVKASEVLDKARQPRLLKLKEDKSLDLVKDDEFPGFLYANVQLESMNPSLRKPFDLAPQTKVAYQLRVYLFRGRNLPPADACGTSDAFVKVRCAGQLAKSKTADKTLNPGWYETLKLEVKLNPFDDSGFVPNGMFLMVFDQDSEEDKDDLIGRIWIEMNPDLISFKTNEMEGAVDVLYRKPKWYNIVYDATDETQGQILIGYSIIKSEEAHLVPDENMYPQSTDTQLHIFCIGLRNIDEKVGDIEPSRCSISFDCSGDKHDPIYTDVVKVQKKGITVNKLITLDLEMPNNQNFCPVLDVFVWEEKPGEDRSKNREMLGITTIDLSEVLKNHYKARKLPPGAVLSSDGDDDDREIAELMNLQEEPKITKAQRKTLANIPEVEGDFDSVALENISINIPWELPIEKQLMEEEEYKKYQILKGEQQIIMQNSQPSIHSSEIEEQSENNQLLNINQPLISFQPIQRHEGDIPQQIRNSKPSDSSVSSKQIINDEDFILSSQRSQSNWQPDSNQKYFKKLLPQSNDSKVQQKQQFQPDDPLSQESQFNEFQQKQQQQQKSIKSQQQLQFHYQQQQQQNSQQVQPDYPLSQGSQFNEFQQKQLLQQKSIKSEQQLQFQNNNLDAQPLISFQPIQRHEGDIPQQIRNSKPSDSSVSSKQIIKLQSSQIQQKYQDEQDSLEFDQKSKSNQFQQKQKSEYKQEQQLLLDQNKKSDYQIQIPEIQLQKQEQPSAGQRRQSQVQRDLRSHGSYQSLKFLQEVDKKVTINKNPEDKQDRIPDELVSLIAEERNVIWGQDIDEISQQSQKKVDIKSVSGRNSEIPMEIPKDEKPIRHTLQVGSQIDFSEASKASSHALSINSDMPKGEVLKIPPPQKSQQKTLTRRRDKFNIFGSLFKNIKKEEIKETYEDYDTDPEENLSIEPEWMKEREILPNNLEKSVKTGKKFRQFNLKRGQTRGKSNLFSSEKPETIQDVCTMKCIFLEEKKGQDINKKRDNYMKMMKPKTYMARFYIMDGVNIVSDSEDTQFFYLKIKVGGVEKDLQDSTTREGVNPQFYILFEAIIDIPGPSDIRIELWNKDSLQDEMVGFTEIDLENRFLSVKWHNFKKKPIEMRKLTTEDGASVGSLTMWVDLILKTQLKLFPAILIEPPPRYKFELRTIVWQTKNCVFKDELEKCNDLFARCGPKNGELQETDTHWRCRAKGSFNWRMKFNQTFPMLPDEEGSDIFKVSLWDRDVIDSNDLLGEGIIKLNTHKMIDKAVKRRKAVTMYQRIREMGGQITDRFWINVYHPDAVDADGNQVSQGMVQCSFELVPIADSLERSNGFGRDSPNIYPFLDQTTGRMSFDIANPIQFIKDSIGPDLYDTGVKCLITGLLVGFLATFGWIFIMQILAGAITN